MKRPVAPLGAIVLAAGRGTRMRSERAKGAAHHRRQALVLWVIDAALELAPERVAGRRRTGRRRRAPDLRAIT